jgi:cytochrome b subunit of formate dehydrogenase
MYQTISIIAFLITFVGIVLHRLVSPSRKKRQKKSTKKRSIVGVLRILVYLLALLCFMVLAVTGFYPTLVLGEHISGYLLMIHATFAPVLAVCLAVLAVMWAGRCRLSYSDWPGFQRFVQRVTLVKSSGNKTPHNSSGLGQKITFWLIIFLALPLILSIILSMFTLFGTYWQELLLGTHRYTALVFAMVVIVHTYLVIRT